MLDLKQLQCLGVKEEILSQLSPCTQVHQAGQVEEWTYSLQVGQPKGKHVVIGSGDCSLLWLDMESGHIFISDEDGDGVTPTRVCARFWLA